MLDLYVDSASVAIENFEDLFEAYPRYADKALSSAMKAEGNRLRTILRDVLDSENSGYVKWKRLNPHTGVLSRSKKGGVRMFKNVWAGKKGSRRRVLRHVGVKKSTRLSPMLKFKGGLRYKYGSDSGVLSVGFINPSAKFESLIRKQAEGYETKVTDRMRKMAFALGFPLAAETAKLVTPARPLMAPVFEAEKNNILRNIEAHFWANISRYMGGQ